MIQTTQLSRNQDLPSVTTLNAPILKSVVKPVVVLQSISPAEFADHMKLSVAQLETATLMLQIIEKIDGMGSPSE
jgi:hypothetical protein